MEITTLFKNLLANVKATINKTFNRILNKNKIIIDEFNQTYDFKNIDECVLFIKNNFDELMVNRNIKNLNISICFINNDKESEIKSLGVINRPFVKIEKKLGRNMNAIQNRYRAVKLIYIRLQIVFI